MSPTDIHLIAISFALLGACGTMLVVHLARILFGITDNTGLYAVLSISIIMITTALGLYVLDLEGESWWRVLEIL